MSTDSDLIDEIIFVMFVTTVFMLNYCSSHSYICNSIILVFLSFFFVIFMLFLGAFSAFPDKQRARKE